MKRIILLALLAYSEAVVVAQPAKHLSAEQRKVMSAIILEAKLCPELPPGCASREQLASDLCGIAWRESRLRAKARNPTGKAVGCFQFLPSTLALCNRRGWGKGDWRKNPRLAARNTIRLAKANLDQYGGTWNDAILAHNIGGPAAAKAARLSSAKRKAFLAKRDGGHAATYLANVKKNSAELRETVKRYFPGRTAGE